MTKRKSAPSDAADLRRRAEKRLESRRSEAGSQNAAEDTERLVHELQVHQIELEVQNEELRGVRAELEAELERYADLYDFAPMGYVTLDSEGAIRKVNLTGAHLLGRERSRLVGGRFGLYVSQECRATFNAFLQEVFSSQGKAVCEVALCPEKSAPLWVHLEGVAFGDGGRECRAVLVDITQRRRIEETLRFRMTLLDYAAAHPLEKLLQKTLDAVGALTGSPVGFYHCVEPDQKTLALGAWSTRTVEEFCSAKGQGSHYPIDQAGVWVDCVHERRPIIHNDYASLPHRTGLPEGHAVVVRELVVPILRQDRIVAIVGVGNKPTDYTDSDVELVSYLADVAWETIERKRAEQAVRQSEQRFRNLFQSMDEGFALCEMINDEAGLPVDFRYLEVNSAFARLTGLPIERVPGRTVRELIPGIESHWIEAYGRVVESGLAERIDSRVEALGKHYEVFAWRSDVGRFASVFSDVTERKAAEDALRASERLHRAIGESIEYGVWVCAPDGRNTYASESFLKLVGLTQEQCSNFGWGDALHPDDAEGTIAAWKECVRTGRNWDIEHRFRGADGQWHPILARGVAVRNERGEIECWAGINLDISHLKQTEADLREGEAALREADQRKNEFLAVLSHELRNPLAPITNSLYILDHAAAGSDQAHRAQAVIGRQVRQLSRLVDDLLDVTRISRNKLPLQRQRLDLNRLVRHALDDHRPQFEKNEVHIELRLAPEPVFVDGDKNRLAQVVGNLLQNAVKFTGPGGTTSVSVSTDTVAQRAVFRVRDTGVGLADEIRARLFQPFAQADTALDRSQGGLGLGLALVKGLVELHGGDVDAQSAGRGLGAEFTARLPLALEDARAGQVAHSSAPAPGSRRRVLIIDDNVDAADTLREALEFNEHEVEVAYSGPAGIAKAREYKPEVVLCDVGLPGLDGYGVARAFKADEALRSVYLVALTGYALPEDVARAQEAGFDRHIAKPPSMETLERTLARASSAPTAPEGPRAS